jgi:periplasmic divalent cation tolerance protein
MDETKKIARELVEMRLAACANIFPISSIYRWKENIEEAEEFVILVKTKSSRVKDIEKKVKEMHSYEVPCIESIRIDEGSADYFNWIDGSVED